MTCIIGKYVKVIFVVWLICFAAAPFVITLGVASRSMAGFLVAGVSFLVVISIPVAWSILPGGEY